MEHIYKGMLLNHKKECIWVSSNEVDEVKSDVSQKEKQISYIMEYMEHIYGI